jgi:hypothetical protein
MSDYHDPIRHGTALSEVYAEDKRPLGLLITAGCPYAVKTEAGPLIQDIRGLTDLVVSEIKGELAEKLSGILETLSKDKERPNVEDILTYIRSLANVVGGGSIRDLTGQDLVALDSAISKTIFQAVNVALPHHLTPFEQLARWAGSIQRSLPVEIFTTNYDLLIEQAFERTRVAYFDGFVGSTKAFLDERTIDSEDLPARWARLWKLHGSVNWQLDEDKSAVRVSAGDPNNCPLIHPSHLKYSESRRMPYLAMIDRLRAFLRLDAAVLAVSGYSFRDEHINDVLLQGVRTNPTAAIFALQFGPITSYPAAVKLGKAVPNFIVLAEDEGIIGGVQAPWRALGQIASIRQDVSLLWQPDAGSADDEELVPGRLLLGDFNNFGSLLAQLVSRKAAKA